MLESHDEDFMTSDIWKSVGSTPCQSDAQSNSNVKITGGKRQIAWWPSADNVGLKRLCESVRLPNLAW